MLTCSVVDLRARELFSKENETGTPCCCSHVVILQLSMPRYCNRSLFITTFLLFFSRCPSLCQFPPTSANLSTQISLQLQNCDSSIYMNELQ